MKKALSTLTAILSICLCFASCTNTNEMRQTRLGSMGTQEQIGHSGENDVHRDNALTPYEALDYLMETEKLYIIDLSPRYEFERDHLIGAVNLDPELILEWIDSIPGDRPILVYDRLGNTSAFVYQTIYTERPDIEEVYYIAGYPLIYFYNTWFEDSII